MAIQIRGMTDAEIRSEGREPPKRSKKSTSTALVPLKEPAADTPADKRSRAQIAVSLPPTTRDSPRFPIRMSAEEVEHLDKIRGSFSRQDAVRLLLRSAERIGL